MLGGNVQRNEAYTYTYMTEEVHSPVFLFIQSMCGSHHFTITQSLNGQTREKEKKTVELSKRYCRTEWRHLQDLDRDETTLKVPGARRALLESGDLDESAGIVQGPPV
jgi:hypothetical protein